MSMQRRQLGKSEIRITPVVLGTWALGGWLWGGTARNRPEDAVRASLDAGINAIDTAPVYGFGLCEELVGRAIRGRRDGLVLATKCGMVWDDRPDQTFFFDTQDGDGTPRRVGRCLRKSSILAECDASLQRLGVDAIDLYQCHWPDPGTPIEETMDALETLRSRGKIRAYGVSNFSVPQLEGALACGRPASNQPKYSLLSREAEAEVLPFCQAHDIGVLCYSPMEMGLLTGKIGMADTFAEGDTRRDRPWFAPARRREVLDALERIKPLAAGYGATLGQLAIAWVLAQPGVTAAIVGARDDEQARSNVRAGELVLRASDVELIRDIFAPLKLDAPYDPGTARR